VDGKESHRVSRPRNCLEHVSVDLNELKRVHVHIIPNRDAVMASG